MDRLAPRPAPPQTNPGSTAGQGVASPLLTGARASPRGLPDCEVVSVAVDATARTTDTDRRHGQRTSPPAAVMASSAARST